MLNLRGLQFPAQVGHYPTMAQRCSVSSAGVLIRYRIVYSVLAPLRLIRDDVLNPAADARNPVPNRQTNNSFNHLVSRFFTVN